MLVKNDPAFIQSYLEDSSNIKGGHAEKIVIPQNVKEISSVLKEANSSKIPVTVSGAGTGQAGGRIPFGGTLLSLERINAIKEIRKEKSGGTAVADAGALISDLKDACDREGLFYTYDPTENTAFLGGTIATNAAGARSFRYGSTRKHVKALTVVLADGAILHLRRGEIEARGRVFEFEIRGHRYKIKLPSYRMPRTKNSAGYFVRDNMDLIDLFVGQEGTLSVIAGAELVLLDKPNDIFSLFIFLRNKKNLLDFITDIRKARPISVEYFDKNSLGLLREKYGNVPDESEAAIFLEDEIEKSEDSVLDKWNSILSSNGILADRTWFAMNETERRAFNEKRHYIPERMNEMAKKSGFPKVSTDLAVPEGSLNDMIRFYDEELKMAGVTFFVFGHIGDAHLHVNMLPRDKRDYDKARFLQFSFVKKAVSFGGTVSAEHGIGKTKKDFLKLLYGEKGVNEMIAVKKALDPNLILGRGNIFDAG